MYVPKQFRIEDKELIAQFIHENGFATLISSTTVHPVATHIPLELEQNADGETVLWGHVAKANPHWKIFEQHPQVLAIFFSDIHHYISSSWYDHPNAPTYNYMSVHVQGTIRMMNKEEEWESVKRLVRKYEKIAQHPIDLETLPPPIQREMAGLVGFEIKIDHIDAAFKLSQNRDDENYERIIAALEQQESVTAKSLARIMAQLRNIKH